MLHVDLQGSGPPVVLLHGFTQSGRSWDPVAEQLAESRTVVLVDAPGHGGSSDVHADLNDGADLMVESVSGAGIDRPDWIGYSMGGRFALHVALRHPGHVRRLVLASATAGIDEAEEREARRAGDEVLASRVETDGVEAFVRFWLSQPMFSTLRGPQARIESRLGSTASGLASSLRQAGTGSQDPLWDRLHELTMPVLAIAGENDTKYAALATRMSRTIGDNAHKELIEGTGHACHLEKPDRFVEIVTAFLDGR